MPASCAAKIVASAWTLADISPPSRISADSAPMQPSTDSSGATTAPLEEPGRETTICSWPERYAAAAALSAERGTLDIMQTTPGSAMGFRYYEPAPYVTQLNAPTVVGGMIMNKSFYDALPPDLKKQFDQELNPALLQMVTNSYDRTTSEAFDKMRETFKAKGRGEIIALSSEERLKFMRPTALEWAAWVQEANKRGYPGEEMMAAFKAIMKKHGLTAPF